MSTKYSKEFKESIIARMFPPENASVPELARETGIPKDTLYSWRLKYRNAQGSVGEAGSSGRFSNKEKLAIIIEAASLNEVELGEYCRRKGLYPEQITGWKKAFIEARTSPGKAEREQVREQSRTIKKLQSELKKPSRKRRPCWFLKKSIRRSWRPKTRTKSRTPGAPGNDSPDR